ncbi:MAG: PorT family protein [Hymenobacter sp.]|nr:MAG: PorT family protein [Hymenobacter sp.]
MKQAATPLLLAGSLLLSAGTVSAQTTFRLGVRGGANRALTTLAAASNGVDGFDNVSGDKSAIYAWQAGAVAEVNFGKLALQPALVFSQKGEKSQTALSSRDSGFPFNTQQTSTNRYNWLELPVNLVYTLHGDHGLQLFAGPYVALAVGGRQRGTTYPYYGPAIDTRPLDFDNQVSYGSDTPNRRLDAGVNFGIGYRQGPVQVQLGYGLGLRNLHQASPASANPGITPFPFTHDFTADAAYNRVAQLTGTYFFSL